MRRQLIDPLRESLGLFWRDKWLLVLGAIPLSIGVVTYYFLGSWLYGDVLGSGEAFLKSKISGERWLNFLSTLFAIVLTIGFYFLISWTFILFISLVSCPFNDIMSSRVERLLLKGSPNSISASLGQTLRKILFIIYNEGKKLSFIIVLSIIGFVLSFIFPPLSLLLSCILVAVSFIDYNWGRYDLGIRGCIKSYRKGFMIYSVAGAFFLLLISIPIINLFVLPIGIVYFTRLYLGIEKKISYENTY